MSVYFISDTHFFHELEALNRPLAGSQMVDLLVNNWNSRVKPGDSIWHLGDFSMHQPLATVQALFSRLNGDKHLIKGNHDHKNKAHRLAWASVHDTHMLMVDKDMFWLSHYAHRIWPAKHHGVYHLYGHSHGHLPGYDRSMDVGVDVPGNNYSPVSVEEVLAKLGPEDYIGKYHH
jgi:calcineurin-like phosphoesterase family protein